MFILYLVLPVKYFFGGLCDRLLSCAFDAADPWLDPVRLVTMARMAEAARVMGLEPEEVRRRYEALALELDLKLAW